MSDAAAITVLLILAHDVSCDRIQIFALGAIKFNSTRDRQKVLMRNREPGNQNSWAGVYHQVGTYSKTITLKQPGEVGGDDNVSIYTPVPGSHLDAKVDGDAMTLYQEVNRITHAPELTLSNGVLKMSDGTSWAKDELTSQNGEQNSWAGVYRNVEGSSGTAASVKVEQPSPTGRPSNVSIWLSEDTRMNATVEGNTGKPYQLVELQKPPSKHTRSKISVITEEGSRNSTWENRTWTKEEKTMDHNGDVGHHDGHDGHNWAGVYHHILNSSESIELKQPGEVGGDNNVSIYPHATVTGSHFDAKVDGDTMTVYQKVTPIEIDATLTLSNGVIDKSDGTSWAKVYPPATEFTSQNGKHVYPPATEFTSQNGKQNNWAGVYRHVKGSAATVNSITVEQPSPTGRPDDVSIWLPTGARINATVNGNTAKLYQRVEPAESKKTRSKIPVIKVQNAGTWAKEGEAMDDAEER